jgi:hypothetical protein
MLATTLEKEALHLADQEAAEVLQILQEQMDLAAVAAVEVIAHQQERQEEVEKYF